mgnify:CR=1 FL=1
MAESNSFYESPNLDLSGPGGSNQQSQLDQEDAEFNALLGQFSADGVITDEERAILSGVSNGQGVQPQEPATLENALLSMLKQADERESMGLPRQAAPGIIDNPVAASTLGSTSSAATLAESLLAGTQGQQSIPQGAPGSAQSFFSEIRNDRALTPEEIARGEAKAAEMGTTFDPNTGFSRKAFEDFQSTQQGATSPAGGLTTVGGASLSEFLSGQAMPERGFTEAERPLSGRGVTLTPDQMNALNAEREAQLDARPDFGTAYSDQELRDIAEAGRMGQPLSTAPTDVFKSQAEAEGYTGRAKTAYVKEKTRLWNQTKTQSEAEVIRKKIELNLEISKAEREFLNDATTKKIATIKQANPDISDADAAAIASGSVRVVTNDLTGVTQLLNIATGESRQIQSQSSSDVDFDVAVPEQTLFSRAAKFTGAYEAGKRAVQGVTGQVGLDVATEESLGAAQDFETAQNELVRAFRESSRYAASEAAALKKELNISLSPFEDPKSAEAKLRSIDKSLARRYENEVATFRDTSFPPSDRQDARMRAKAIAEFRANLGVPTSSTQGNVPSDVDPKEWEFMSTEERNLFN